RGQLPRRRRRPSANTRSRPSRPRRRPDRRTRRPRSHQELRRTRRVRPPPPRPTCHQPTLTVTFGLVAAMSGGALPNPSQPSLTVADSRRTTKRRAPHPQTTREPASRLLKRATRLTRVFEFLGPLPAPR